MSNIQFPLDQDAIKKLIPHREPFLLVDEIISADEKSAVGKKSLLEGDWYFTGHYPGFPVFPGVLIVEHLAQVAAAYAALRFKNESTTEAQPVYFIEIESAKFRKPVKPGDTIISSVMHVKTTRSIEQFECKAMVGETLVTNCNIKAMLAPKTS